jgi:hypothetical protein
VTSTWNANFATANIKEYYLGTLLVRENGQPAVEYIRINLARISKDVQLTYELSKYARNGFVYMEIYNSIYDLP